MNWHLNKNNDIFPNSSLRNAFTKAGRRPKAALTFSLSVWPEGHRIQDCFSWMRRKWNQLTRVFLSLCVTVCVHYKGEGEIHWLVKVLPLWQRMCDKTFQPLSGPWRRPWENNTCVECCRLHKNRSCGVHKKKTHTHTSGRQISWLEGL